MDKKYYWPRLLYYVGLLFIGQTVWRPAFSLTVSDVFFLFALLATIAETLVSGKIRFSMPASLMVGLFLFIFGGVISSGTSEKPLLSLIALAKYLYIILVWFWLGTVLLRRRRHLLTAVTLWTISAAITGAGAIVQFVWGDVIPGTSPVWGRMTGFTGHVNELAGVTGIAIVPSLMLASQSGRNVWRAVTSSVITVLIAAGLVLSGSVSGFLAAAVAFFIWFAIVNISIKNLLWIGMACVSGALILTLFPKFVELPVVGRLRHFPTEVVYSETSNMRIETFRVAWKTISSNPLVGKGLGPSSGTTDAGYVVHNLFLLNWFEAGLFGLMGMVLIVASVFSVSITLLKKPLCGFARALVISLFASYVSFLIFGMAQPIYYNRYGWISAALILAVYSVRRLFVQCSVQRCEAHS